MGLGNRSSRSQNMFCNSGVTLVGKDQLQSIRTKVLSRFGKVVTKAEAIFAIDEHASFIVDKPVDSKESG